jgi:DNA polymerase-3 subunit chi
VTKVDFYILQNGSREQTACKLIEKAYNLGHRIYVHTASEDHSRQLDELLWVFRDGSFLPHEQYLPGKPTESPITIGNHTAPESDAEVMINLAPEVPLFFSRFLRVAELVGTDTESKSLGRERFRFYRDRGYPLDTHELGK